MPGAIVPDDWDGSSFNCQRIQWPASSQWLAILLGQVSEPTFLSYWDASSGDENEAAKGVVDAFALTVPEVYEKECDDVPTGIPVPTFKVSKDTAQVLTASTWTEVIWDVLTVEENDPDFNVGANIHAIRDANLLGLWHYTLNLKLTTVSQMFLRSIVNVGPPDVALSGDGTGTAVLSWDYVWRDLVTSMQVNIWSAAANNIDILIKNCQWSGFFVGPVDP